MDSSQELVQRTRGMKEVDARPNDNTSIASHSSSDSDFPLPKLKHYGKWLRIAICIILLLVGQIAATLLGRFYFEQGGNSKWMATLVQTAGFPVFIPLKIYFSSSKTTTQLPLIKLILLYIAFGLLIVGDNMMYSIGLRYVPVSTYALLCATQLAFNAVTSYFINAQKFTALVVNSVVILTISACLLAINADNEGTNNSSNHLKRMKYVIGFLCTIGASATYALLMSLVQFSFEKVIKDESFNTVVCMQLYPAIVATLGCVIGLFGSGEWKTLNGEMMVFKSGKMPYVLVLAFSAISWQVATIGLFGLILEVSSLFANVISTLCLPIIPILAVVFFHDKMNGVKVVSLILAMWGFLSYIYQHYQDSVEAASKARKENGIQSQSANTEMC